jgi:acyl-CoA synthetase (AMP-forming)/AMP-acid ligase II
MMLAQTPTTIDNVSDVLTSLPERICDVVKVWVERSPDRYALVEASGAWTYRQLDSAVGATQAWLLASGVRPGDRVMIVCENCRAFVAILLALARLDAWPVLVNARLSAREIDAIRDHCGARRVIYTTSVSPHAREHAKRHGAVVEEVANLGQIGIGPLDTQAEPEPIDPVGAHRVAALIYTSGTTGLPKGVMLTHRNLLFMAAGSVRVRSLTPQDRHYGVLPMSHAVGLSVVLLGTLLSGATLYLAPRFDPIAALQVLERDRLTIVLGAPAMFAMLVDYAKLKGLKSLSFPDLRVISSSGAVLQQELKAKVESLFGQVLHNGYGVTECSPTIAQTRIEDPRSDTSVGRIFPGVEAKLVGLEGQIVPEGEVGELRVSGPTIMKGYYRAPEETAAAIDAEGWFNTRDLARFKDGYLFIVGRTKELIVHLGFNVYPAEVEEVLNAHSAVVRSAVIGRSTPGANGDEEVVAFVVPKPGSSVTADELAAHAARRLASYKRPSSILLVPEMPMTLTGKVIKAELAKMAQCNFSAR